MSAERLRLGQWFTPEAVADLALALALPSPVSRARVFDPACGDGVFLDRARVAGVLPAHLYGVEIDPAAAAAAARRVPRAQLTRGDFFDQPLPQPGFDVVVGNPPYVRQERLEAAAKQRIRRCLARELATVGEDLDLGGRGDLAAAFVARGLCALRPGGRLALVVSSALLDAGYARPLWQLVQKLGRVLALVEAPGERWFADAAVNAMIVVAERGGTPAPVTIARLEVSTEEAAARVRGLADLAAVAELRHADPDRPELWARALRSPRTWFDFAGAAALVPLGELAEVRRGVTSGANEIFYLERDRARSLGLERAVVAPLVRSPREQGADNIPIHPGGTSHVALVCPPGDAALASYPRAAAYLRGHADAATRPTLRARPSWWALSARPARLFLTKAYAARFVQRFASAPVVADQRVYAVYPRRGVAVELLAAVLNSTYTAFALESLGRASLGEGALEWTVADAASLPVLDPRALSQRSATAALRAFAALCERRIGAVWDEAAATDRARLDRAVGAAELWPTLPAIHDSLVAAVRRRQQRARGERSSPVR